MKKEVILVANRGEIALRIMRSAREMGFASVAIYSEADKNQPHVKFADKSVCIGPPDPLKSYLNIPAVLSAAELVDATMIHPGYGFLSENARFADICEKSGFKFIGSSPETISLLGDKIESKRSMAKYGLPQLPGSEDAISDVEVVTKLAEEIGYPVILKASAGGGGRGMKIVRKSEDIRTTFAQVKQEAKISFNDDRIFVEKYVENPHHVEFQVIGDQHGNVRVIGERECSIQRRHQKIIEEAPSPHLSRAKMEEVASSVQKALESISYQGLGTAEFIMDKEQNFYFLEVNTRIQVEHPVTEMIYGIDLVKEQIKVALGEVVTNADLSPKGHAIECRINAEDPVTFTPSAGRIDSYHLPQGIGVRVDTLLSEDNYISPYYDSMIGKLIVHGEDREHAIERMKRALDEIKVNGVKTNIELHRKILRHEAFLKPSYNTSFLNNFR